MGDADRVLRDVRLKDLEAFVVAATAGSFRAASAHLYVSQPAVTRAIKRLETLLGVRLLDRGPRGAQLTASGQALLVKARRLLNLMAEIQHGQLDTVTSTLWLGAAATAAGSFLAPFLAEWIPAHPSVRVHVIEDGAARLGRRLRDGEVDIAIIATPMPALFDSRPIRRSCVCAHFPEEHPLNAESGPLPVADLAAYPLLLNQPSFISAQLMSEQFELAGIHPQVVYESSIGQTLAALAEANMGVAVFSDSVDLRASPLRRRTIVDASGNPVAFELHVAWRRIGTPQWIRQFGEQLSTFTTSRSLPAQRSV